ncbi:pectin lyase fold/virulence factor [Lophiotrema nucula]|uniref:Pectin lyase fold/virulence factor n=1 Tax=Lophiotrema nucula TaxID=690887 RepID=A0A6A5ZX56_9PLEO|nr:pectin lyase fold/virulence factor [Lophiotrema nucula]
MSFDLRFLFSLISLVTLVFAHPSSSRRDDPCTVLAQGYEVLDDSPAINNALKTCGKGGTILLPQDQAYSIRSPLDFSTCRNCTLLIEGQLYISRDYDFWARSDSVFTLADVHGVTITSNTRKGLIDGQAIGYYTSWYNDVNAYGNRYWKFLTHITNRSSAISISNLEIRNPIHGFFVTRGNASDIHFENLTMTVEQQWGREPFNEASTFGFQIGNAVNVKARDIGMKFTHKEGLEGAQSPVGVCAAVDVGAYNVSLRDVSCEGAWGGALVMVGSVQPYLNGPGLGNIEFKNWAVVGSGKDGAATGFKDFHYGATKDFKTARSSYIGGRIHNIKWQDVVVTDGPPVVADFCYFRTRDNAAFTMACPANLKVDVGEVQFTGYEVGEGYTMPVKGWGGFNNRSSITLGFENWTMLRSS